MRKPAARNAHNARLAPRSGGSTFIGILIGLVLGLAIALGVAWYINKMPNPFREKPQAPAVPVPSRVETPALPVVAAKPDPLPDVSEAAKAKDPAAEKDKADTLKIVPPPPAKEAFFLQMGSFQNAPDADNLKARLALLGIEAAIQTRTLPEKGVWHRVRAGPYSEGDELNRLRSMLTQHGIATVLVKVREADK